MESPTEQDAEVRTDLPTSKVSSPTTSSCAEAPIVCTPRSVAHAIADEA